MKGGMFFPNIHQSQRRYFLSGPSFQRFVVFFVGGRRQLKQIEMHSSSLPPALMHDQKGDK